MAWFFLFLRFPNNGLLYRSRIWLGGTGTTRSSVSIQASNKVCSALVSSRAKGAEQVALQCLCRLSTRCLVCVDGGVRPPLGNLLLFAASLRAR